MAERHDHPDEDWSLSAGKWTVVLTVALTALYVAAVALYVR